MNNMLTLTMELVYSAKKANIYVIDCISIKVFTIYVHFGLGMISKI